MTDCTTKGWVERQPKVGETVKFEYGIDFKREIVGVVLKFFNQQWIIDLGSHKLYLDQYATFFVWQ